MEHISNIFRMLSCNFYYMFKGNIEIIKRWYVHSINDATTIATPFTKAKPTNVKLWCNFEVDVELNQNTTCMQAIIGAYQQCHVDNLEC